MSSLLKSKPRHKQTEKCLNVLTLVPAAALGLESETLMIVQVTPGRIGSVATELAGELAGDSGWRTCVSRAAGGKGSMAATGDSTGR